jgi:hypothetical protein
VPIDDDGRDINKDEIVHLDTIFIIHQKGVIFQPLVQIRKQLPDWLVIEFVESFFKIATIFFYNLLYFTISS